MKSHSIEVTDADLAMLNDLLLAAPYGKVADFVNRLNAQLMAQAAKAEG